MQAVVAFSLAYLLFFGFSLSLGIEPGLWRLLSFGGGLGFAFLHPRLRSQSWPIAMGLLLALAAGPEKEREPLVALAFPVHLKGEVVRVHQIDSDLATMSLSGGHRVRWIEPSCRPIVGDSFVGSGRHDPARGGFQVVADAGLIEPGSAYARSLHGLRERAIARLERGLSPKSAAIASSLLFGTNRLDPAFRQELTDVGALHFFAVSGFHVAMLCALLMRVSGPRSLALIAAVVCYGALTGFRTPATRAVLMAVYFLFGRWLGRQVEPRRILPFAATLILASDPEAIRSAGFLLSFCAYAGILFLGLPCMPELRPEAEDHWWRKLVRGLLSLLVVSQAAQLMSWPATLSLFQGTSSAAILASVLLSPLMPPLFVCGFLHLCLPELEVGTFLFENLLQLLIAIVMRLNHLPGTPITTGTPTPLALAIAVIALLALALALPRIAPKKRLLALAIGTLALLPLLHNPMPGGAELLAVGQGQAVLLRRSEAEAPALFDTGPSGPLLLRALQRAGVSALSAVAISHRHADHRGGLDALRTRIPIGRLQDPARGERLLRGEPTTIAGAALWPPRAALETLDENDASGVLHAQLPNGRLLIPGDIESDGLRGLLDLGDALAAEVLVLPHHGAANEHLLELLLRASPTATWISAAPGFVDERTWLTLAYRGITPEMTRADRRLTWPPRIARGL